MYYQKERRYNGMEFKYNVTGAARKELVNAISAITEAPVKYLGAPTFSYEVDYFTIDKNGTVSFDDRADSEEIEMLVERLLEKGFEPEAVEQEPSEPKAAENANGAEPGKTALCIYLPDSLFTEEGFANLARLIAAKGALIQKALGADELPLLREDGKVGFPWFRDGSEPDAVSAYTHFVTALCQMANGQKRVTAKEKEVVNEKYAFRCFLLRLGFIGKEYKDERKLLLKNLSGNGAFKTAKEDEDE